MKHRAPLSVTRKLVEEGLGPKFARKVRRELKMAHAEGIVRGLKAGLGPGDVCIDCGAHYGEVTTELAETGALVHSFEPDPHSWSKLNTLFADTPNVALHNVAVGAEAGEVTLFRNSEFENNTDVATTGSTILEQNAGAGAEHAVKVACIDFPDFLEKQIAEHGRINFLKMDIEGAEVPVLEALVETDLLTHVGLTVVETHRWLFPDWAANYDRLHEIAGNRPDMNLYLGWI